MGRGILVDFCNILSRDVKIKIDIFVSNLLIKKGESSSYLFKITISLFVDSLFFNPLTLSLLDKQRYIYHYFASVLSRVVLSDSR